MTAPAATPYPLTLEGTEMAKAALLPGYEVRLPQQRMAERVYALLERAEQYRQDVFRVKAAYEAGAEVEDLETPVIQHLISQAGTGTGKSFGYLCPTLLFPDLRTVVSVSNRTLQDQLATKDLPFLDKIAAEMGVPFSWTILKGQANYLCVNRLLRATDEEAPSLGAIMRFLETAPADFQGERGQLGVYVGEREWSNICGDAEECSGCRKAMAEGGPKCYVQVARQRVAVSRVVVVNHALLMTDLKIKRSSAKNPWDFSGGMLGRYHCLVVDEAHDLEKDAAEHLGHELTEVAFTTAIDDGFGWLNRYDDITEGLASRLVNELFPQLRAAAGALFRALDEGTLTSARIARSQDLIDGLLEAVGRTYEAWTSTSVDDIDEGEAERAKFRRNKISSRLSNLLDGLEQLLLADWGDWVRYVSEEEYRRDRRKTIKVNPVAVDKILAPHLFDRVPSALVSATLRASGRMTFISQRVGVRQHDVVDVGTPFDYRAQAMFYVPTVEALRVVKGASDVEWEALCSEMILDLIRTSRGRALVIFTSRRHMLAAVDQIGSRVEQRLLVQEKGRVAEIGEEFKRDVDSVLFGLKSFATGFDPRGETCSLVVAAKLPFPNGFEPLTCARIEAVKRAARSDWAGFSDYQVPLMSLDLQQTAGRLIRSTTDQGVFAALDSRIHARWTQYGRSVVEEDFREWTMTDRMSDVERFFAQRQG